MRSSNVWRKEGLRMRSAFDIIIAPVVTEKSNAQAGASKYVFR